MKKALVLSMILLVSSTAFSKEYVTLAVHCKSFVRGITAYVMGTAESPHVIKWLNGIRAQGCERGIFECPGLVYYEEAERIVAADANGYFFIPDYL